MAENEGVNLVMEWVSILEEIHQGQKELATLARENSAKIDRTWPALARMEARILEVRRDVQESVGELLGEIDANKKKLTNSGQKSKDWPMRLSSSRAGRIPGQ